MQRKQIHIALVHPSAANTLKWSFPLAVSMLMRPNMSMGSYTNNVKCKRSTETAADLLHTGCQLKTLKAGNQTDVIIMDFAKAFDKVFSLEIGHQTEKLWNHWSGEQMGRRFSPSAVSESCLSWRTFSECCTSTKWRSTRLSHRSSSVLNLH